METTNLSRAEMEALRQVADRQGMTVEEAAQEAFKRGLEEMFRLPVQHAQVIPLKGLDRA